jgi:fructokinase
MYQPDHHPVVCFGEVLWDILPTGTVPGGAPMNVAYHLHKQNKNPALITRIGKDEKGTELLAIFSNHGVCTDYFQVDEQHETGKVYAHLNEKNEATYEIVQPVAWDFISLEPAHLALVEQASFFVFGSLACRNETSRHTLFQLLEKAKTKVLDINLRAPHYNRPLLEELLSRADILKLNDQELELLGSWYGTNGDFESGISAIGDRFQIPLIVVTCGADGAVLYDGQHFHQQKGIEVAVADTVGSGDAFLAGLLSQMMNGASYPAALEYANKLGAFIATKKGACPEYQVGEI